MRGRQSATSPDDERLDGQMSVGQMVDGLVQVRVSGVADRLGNGPLDLVLEIDNWCNLTNSKTSLGREHRRLRSLPGGVDSVALDADWSEPFALALSLVLRDLEDGEGADRELRVRAALARLDGSQDRVVAAEQTVVLHCL
jgi:hypothetical protein